jgi:hypothetical protein
MPECSFCPGRSSRCRQYFIYLACPKCQRALPLDILLKREPPMDPILEAYLLDPDRNALQAFNLYATETPKVAAFGYMYFALEAFKRGELKPEIADVLELAIRASLLFGWGPQRLEDIPDMIPLEKGIHDGGSITAPADPKISETEGFILIRLAAEIQSAMVRKYISLMAGPDSVKKDPPARVILNAAIKNTSEAIGRMFIETTKTAIGSRLEGPARELEAWKLARMT